jgi:Ca-activated chloride channel homolog
MSIAIPSRKSLLIDRRGCLTVCAIALCLCSSVALAQQPFSAGLPFINAGPFSTFAQLDFAQIYLDTQNRELKKNHEIQAQRKELLKSGVVSALDLNAPNKAIEEFDRASELLREQNSKEAIVHLRKAISAYPKFVSAHNALGLAYQDQQDGRAKEEFETATKLDDKFCGSFLNLGLLALSEKDFATARSNLEKAVSLRPTDAKILAALAFVQNSDHDYQQSLETVQLVHAREHRGMANVHYIGAADAMALNNTESMQHELAIFLSEDPTNPLAPIARKNLDVLERRKNAALSGGQNLGVTAAPEAQQLQTFPNTDRLKAEIAAAGGEASKGANCKTCEGAETNLVAEKMAAPSASAPAVSISGMATSRWAIRKVVDETAVFFSASSHGHMVSDLQLSDVQIRDDNKPPEKVWQFVPQSKLPLRLGLLIDSSGSVQSRFGFEKHAAAKFLQKVLNSSTDLGFVAGFSIETSVTQDFAANPAELGRGIEKIQNGGGTSLFDAVSFGCWKLAAYPDEGRAARVLVILSDGEDNSSHRSLKQALEEAETTGVTIYTVSTSESGSAKTDADQILKLLAERSGGEALFPGDMLTLEGSLNKLQSLIRNRYLVAYKPAAFAPSGKYRSIHITAEKDGKRLQVQVRKGYFARTQSANK